MSYTICSRFKGEHIVYAGYTICTSREHIVYGAFCGSTMHSLIIFNKSQINKVQDVSQKCTLYRPNSITKAVDGLFKYNRNRA